jgi:sterol desaturase/sphingolipid hydroxylase (fatty acid hydroxylase superfamily)
MYRGVYSEIMKTKAPIQKQWLLPLILAVGVALISIKDAAGWGIFTGAALVLIPFMVIVQHLKQLQKKRRVAKKRVFYEPTQLKLFMYYIAVIIVLMFLFALTFGIPIYGEWLTKEMENNTYWAGVIMMFYITSLLVVPMFIYMVHILTRYDKIIEYKTPEWYEYRKSLNQK